MRVIIAGMRDFTCYETVCAAVLAAPFPDPIAEVVCGCARGVDTLGRRWANENGVPVKDFPAEWDRFGDGAGPIRNQDMANYADGLIAVWNGRSSGTKDMIIRAQRKGLKVYVHRV